ncbi:PQQ-dependent sugar dehydrogenase [Streptomyces sp. NPDC056061]|uniref:PQQ-dependent sugar dehydrogenase n=1 Tax=Streptomyces sp. NPDC056061 TaxID=3345700 RepID=UPI0035E343AD
MQVATLTMKRSTTAALAAMLLCAASVQAAPGSAAAAATRYEAESATIVRGAAESNHSGYSGTGFVNGDNVVGSYVEFAVDAAAAGTGRIAVRYSNGTDAARPADIAVGGKVVSAAHAFEGTADWNTWATFTVTAPLAAGSNKVRLTSTSADGLPNLDYIDVTVTAPDAVPPTAPGTPSASGLTANGVTLNWGAATDDTAVTAYDIRSGDTVLTTVTGTPPATKATLTGLACASPYTLDVVARDAAGNASPPSKAVTFTTPACTADGGVPSEITAFSTGWTIPWGIHWMPDSKTALVTERDSFKVFRVTPDGTRTQVGTVPNAVTTGGEGGLLGVAVDPEWSTNHYVYFMHTASEGNRVARMTYDGSSLTGYKVLLQGIKKNKYHNGGRLAFGPDGYLYASTGEAQDRDLAQDKNSLNGKILRMTRDGKAAPGNPFGTYVYSYGHRNPQGLAFDRNGRLWEAEFGDSSKDELNLIQPGKNYGWPICEGSCSTAGMTNPKMTWKVSEASPSGIAIVRNVIYMAALRGERLWRVPIDGDTGNLGTPTAHYVGSYGRLRTVTTVPGRDELWLSTTNCDNNGKEPAGADKLFRVSIT